MLVDILEGLHWSQECHPMGLAVILCFAVNGRWREWEKTRTCWGGAHRRFPFWCVLFWLIVDGGVEGRTKSYSYQLGVGRKGLYGMLGRLETSCHLFCE